MTRVLLTIPFAFFVGESIPGVGEGGSIGGLILQFGAFGVVCWLAYYLVTKRMPEIEQRHLEERMAAETRREQRDKQAVAERHEEREMFAATLSKVIQDSTENRDAFLASQCKYQHRLNEEKK